ncbi:Hsp20 family protein [Sneathiella chungangensis]|uniref:Hsp20 family protein n=1 Tax=Sneathiella chungangensis TaxID=1418234 RepID=A0A845MEM7_9PROT|nr:Hsp20 family protein [Sneathiella chungangensis]MZR22072.1 Hsp20 family protein [Sneathiella chungangensis]
MRAYDFSPLLRTTVGFDRIEQLFRTLERASSENSYPPYNIVRKDADNYRITMAVAGFDEDQIEIVATQNSLKVSGKSEEEKDEVQYLHRGLASRSFAQNFELAETIKVVGATMENGLLHIDLVREIPEELKPRTIEISKPKGKGKLIENKAA